MGKLLLILALASPAAFANGIYVAAGFDFRPDAFDLALGYQANHAGLEASLIKEDRSLFDRQRNQVMNLDLMGYLPISGRSTAFIKAGASHFRYDEAARRYVNGKNVGMGIDYRLGNAWSVRTSLTYCRLNGNVPLIQEQLFSLGVKYSF